MDRLVTLFGGGGFLGRYVAQELLKAGARVRIAQRDPGKAWFLKPLGGLVTRLPVGREHPGRTAGPTFELFYGADYLLPHKDAAWAVMEERMRVLAELATRCRDVCSPLYLPAVSKVAEALIDLANQLAKDRPAGA